MCTSLSDCNGLVELFVENAGILARFCRKRGSPADADVASEVSGSDPGGGGVLTQHAFDHIAVDICQPEIASGIAVGQSFVVDAH